MKKLLAILALIFSQHAIATEVIPFLETDLKKTDYINSDILKVNSDLYATVRLRHMGDATIFDLIFFDNLGTTRKAVEMAQFTDANITDLATELRVGPDGDIWVLNSSLDGGYLFALRYSQEGEKKWSYLSNDGPRGFFNGSANFGLHQNGNLTYVRYRNEKTSEPVSILQIDRDGNLLRNISVNLPEGAEYHAFGDEGVTPGESDSFVIQYGAYFQDQASPNNYRIDHYLMKISSEGDIKKTAIGSDPCAVESRGCTKYYWASLTTDTKHQILTKESYWISTTDDNDRVYRYRKFSLNGDQIGKIEFVGANNSNYENRMLRRIQFDADNNAYVLNFEFNQSESPHYRIFKLDVESQTLAQVFEIIPDASLSATSTLDFVSIPSTNMLHVALFGASKMDKLHEVTIYAANLKDHSIEQIGRGVQSIMGDRALGSPSLDFSQLVFDETSKSLFGLFNGNQYVSEDEQRTRRNLYFFKHKL